MINNSIPSYPNISKKFYITYNGKISQRNINILIKCIHDYLEKEYNHLYLLICSDGGELNPALHAYNYLANQSSLTVTTHNTGTCGSAANMLFLTGQVRYACEHSYFWFHEINIPIQPAIKISQAQRLYEEMVKIEDFQLEIYKSKFKINDGDLWKYCRTENCLTSKEAVSNGLIDGVREIPIK